MIGVPGNAAMAIAKRNAIFSVVPRVYWIAAYDAAKQVAVGSLYTCSLVNLTFSTTARVIHNEWCVQ
jgi:uncharacterized protein YqfA (UPF0365 family)